MLNQTSTIEKGAKEGKPDNKYSWKLGKKTFEA
jgi:hypothetical protein